MIGRAPRWAILIMGLIALIWIIPLFGIVVMSLRPVAETSLGWWRLDSLTLTLSAWERVWDRYPLADAFWTTAVLAGTATFLTMLLTPAAADAFPFLKFRFRRLLLIISSTHSSCPSRS
jgi:ABC-type glycerol-3-phosphate transport system permease component